MKHTRPLIITRRGLVKGGLVLAASSLGCATPRARPSFAPCAPTTRVDMHCHVFNANDLPVQGFLKKLVEARLQEWMGNREKARRAVQKLGCIFAAIETASRRLAADESEEVLLTRLVKGEGDPWEVWDQLKRWRREPAEVEQALKSELLLLCKNDAPSKVHSLQPVEEADADVQEALSAMEADLGPQEVETLNVVPTFVVSIVLKYVFKNFPTFFVMASGGRASMVRSMASATATVQLFAPSLVDFDAWTERAPNGSVLHPARIPPARQVAIVGKLAQLSRDGLSGIGAERPMWVHGFAAFDPRREVEADLSSVSGCVGDPIDCMPVEQLPGAFLPVRYAIERGGFLGVKLYPPVGFRPIGNGVNGQNASGMEHLPPGMGPKLDVELMKLYRYCVANDVPIMAHVGEANAFDERFKRFAHPDNWGQVLSQPGLSGLRLSLGHLGIPEGVDTKKKKLTPGDIQNGWAWSAMKVMRVFPNVYADLANAKVNPEDRRLARVDAEILKHLLKDATLRRLLSERLMFGTDFFMNTLFRKDFDEYDETVHDALRSLGLGETFFEGFFSGNALRFLGVAGPAPTRALTRLRKFYDGHETPPWLAGQNCAVAARY